MKMLRKNIFTTAIVTLFLILSAQGFAEGTAEQQDDGVMRIAGTHADVWKLEATDPLLIGGYGHNFNYDGKKVIALKGRASVNVNAASNTGKMEVNFSGTITPEAGKTYKGDIRIIFTEYTEGPPFWEGGIADFVYLHGDTKQGPPVMPKVRTYLASWGLADVYINNKLVYKGLDGHMMLTERSRDKNTYAIYDSTKKGYYSPKDPGNSSIANPDEKEIHFVAHTVDQDGKNFPPNSVWIHLNFMTVKETM